MGRVESCVYFSIFQLLILGVTSQDRLLVDVESDIPKDGTWEIDCDDGYADLSTDFDCGPDNGGTIDIPPEKLNGEKGFWTVCAPYGCRLKYHVQPGDTLFKARVYQSQSNFETEVSFDGIVWDYIPGEGWVEFEETLGVAGKNEVSLRFSHFSSDMFNILDKIVINGDFDTPTTTVPTTEATTETTESSSSTEATTEATTETTTEKEFSSSTDSTTTSYDISSTTDLDTTPVPTTEDGWDSSSTVSDDPIGSSSEPSTSDEPEGTSSTDVSTTLSTDDPTSSPTDDPTSSPTDDPTSSPTDNPSTEIDSTTSSEISSLPSSEPSDTTKTELSSPATSPASPCTDPPCITSSMRPSTTKKPSNSAGFMGGLWGKLLLSVIGAFLFILLSACCLRFVCLRGGILRRRNRKEEDLEDIISQSGSSNVNISGKTSPNPTSSEGELYLYMNRYPYLLPPSLVKASNAPNKVQISSIPPPSTSPPPPSSTYTPWSPRAIYRESTPYMAFDEQNSGKSIGTIPSSTHVINDDYQEAMNNNVETENARSNQTTQISPRKEASPVIPPQQHYPETQNHNRSTWVEL